MPDLTVTSHDGLELAVRDHQGEGPDVIILHGAMRNLEDWRMVLRHLSGLRVVAVDQRFHGHSGVPDSASYSDLARDLEAVIKALALTNPYVVGHSMGGMSAMLYAVEHRECPGVLNIDGYDFRQRELYDELPDQEVDDFLQAFAERSSSFLPQEDSGDEAWRDQQLQIASGMDGQWGVDPEQTQAVLARSFVKISGDRWQRRPPVSFWQITTAGGTPDLLDLLRRVECPVTMLVCRKGMGPAPSGTDYYAIARQGLVRHVRRIAEERPNVRAETIDATHGVIYEQPDVVAKLIMSLAS
jgi:pimeloyl-ACP methyl ester carboxylesterase